MIDTLMALWNRGYGGRGIIVSTAFFLICISISLLLVSVGNSWPSLFFHDNSSGNQRNIISSADLTASAQSNNFQPTADDTVTIYAPDTTPTPNPCATSSISK